MDYLFLALMLFDVVVGQTPATTQSPTANVSIPAFATLRPTVPTMPPIMMPDVDRTTAENKTDELPIVAVYFMMLGLTGIATGIGICFNIYGSLFPSEEKRKEIEEREKIILQEEW
jgi:hypothetical protein